jgi:tRNA dimethylallyltransferase
VADIRSREKEPLFVGGTPLYLKSLLRGLFEGPPANWQLRREIEQELAHVGQQALYDRLQQVDPVAASHIHPHDTRRLIRALEVFRATGEPISHQQLQFDEGRPVEAMIDAGLVEEVRWLTASGHELGRTARQAVGYREALAYLSGEYDQNEMVSRIKVRTRRFAKRQGTWFRSLSECRFVDLTGDTDPSVIAESIARSA